MKFQINLETIKEYLRRMSTSVQSVASRVEFTGVLINVFDNSIVFEGRNDWMDTKIEETSFSNMKIIETGRALVKAQMLNEIVQKMQGQYITFTKIDSNVITIEDVDSNYKINLLSDENFEHAKFMSDDEITQRVVIPSKLFRKSVNKTSFAGSENHSKFIYEGLSITINDKKITTTACDGIKIASWTGDIDHDERLEKIIPLKVVRELVKVLPDNKDYDFSFSNNMCVLRSGNMINQFSLIEGTFPRFDKLFNKEIYNKKLVIEKEIISSAIDRATILSPVTAVGARISFDISSESFSIDSSTEIGSTKIEVRGYDYQGDLINISISPKILIDGIKHCESDKVELLLIDSSSSILLKTEKDDFVFLMSPMI